MKKLLLVIAMFSMASFADHSCRSNEKIDGLQELLYAVDSLYNGVDGLVSNCNGEDEELGLRQLKNQLTLATANVQNAINNLRTRPKTRNEDISLQRGGFAPSCTGNGNPYGKDTACCAYPGDAFCFRYEVKCDSDEVLDSARVSCSSGEAKRAEDLLDSNGKAYGKIFVCQKLGWQAQTVVLSGSKTCRKIRR